MNEYCPLPFDEQFFEKRFITRWWKALRVLPEELSALRACETPEQAASLELASELHEMIPSHDAYGVAALAALLSQVNRDDEETRFLSKLSSAAMRPALSEFRFEGLSSCKTLDELFTRIKKAIILLDRHVNVESLAECFLDWVDAHYPTYNGQPELARLLLSNWRNEFQIAPAGPADPDLN